jgi:hypothetical protein
MTSTTVKSPSLGETAYARLNEDDNLGSKVRLRFFRTFCELRVFSQEIQLEANHPKTGRFVNFFP